MPERALVLVLFALTYVPSLISLPASAQQSDPRTTTLPSGVQRIAGTDPSSQIQYVRLILNGTPHSAAVGATDQAAPDPPPILIAQCSLRPNGKYLFEMFSSFGGPANLAFYPPWKSSGPSVTFPPRAEKITLIMDFLGYTHVKPFRRQWEIPVEAPTLYRYNPPGTGSPNLEEVSYFLRYLRSLPTLRLTRNSQAVEYLTTPLLADIHSEPLCRASGI